MDCFKYMDNIAFDSFLRMTKETLQCSKGGMLRADSNQTQTLTELKREIRILKRTFVNKLKLKLRSKHCFSNAIFVSVWFEFG